MEKNKKKKIIIIAMIVIGVILIGILAYLLFIKKDEKVKQIENNQSNNIDELNNNNNYVEDKKYKAQDFDEMMRKLKKEAMHADYTITDEKIPKELDIGWMKYHAVLSDDGKVSVNKYGEPPILLSNIYDAKNIDFSNYGYFRLFILLGNGDVYVYELGDVDEKKDTATKINEIKDAEKFVHIDSDYCINCGGNTEIGIINKDNQYVELDSIAA